jgi:hypothetical protein
MAIPDAEDYTLPHRQKSGLVHHQKYGRFLHLNQVRYGGLIAFDSGPISRRMPRCTAAPLSS